MSYADEVAPMPERADDTTMDGLIRAYLANAEQGLAASSLLIRRAFGEGSSEADNLRYMLNLHTWLWQAEVADLLMRLQQIAPPEDADGIAVTFVANSQAGDYYPEMLWEWLDERGIDPERLRAEGEQLAREMLAQDRTPRPTAQDHTNGSAS